MFTCVSHEHLRTREADRLCLTLYKYHPRETPRGTKKAWREPGFFLSPLPNYSLFLIPSIFIRATFLSVHFFQRLNHTV